MKKLITLFIALIFSVTSGCAKSPYMATGIKIGEVSDSEAWVRLTRNEKRVDFGAPMPEISYTLASTIVGEPIIDMKYRQSDAVPSVEFPDGSSIDTTPIGTRQVSGS